MYSIVLLVIYSTLVLFLTTGSALATSRDLVKDNIVTIERIASRYATVGKVSVQEIDSVVSVSGAVKKRTSYGRGPIPGHIDVEFIGPGGRTFVKKMCVLLEKVLYREWQNLILN